MNLTVFLSALKNNSKTIGRLLTKPEKGIDKDGGGSKHTLDAMEKKLFFALFCLKCYPTLDLAGFYFGVNRSQPFRWTKVLLPILEKTLGHEIVLPKRQISSPEEFEKEFPEIKDLFIDGTERPIQRPKKNKKQSKHYSGKKKRHSRKNIVVSDDKRKILILTPAKYGKARGKKLLDKSGLLPNMPEDIAIWTDTGFTGINRKNFMMPKKKPKGKSLTLWEKSENKIISGIRALSEHAINGPKRFRVISDIFRNRRAGMDDKVMLITCGLWNYHLRMATR